MVGDAVVAAEDGGSYQAEEFLGLGAERAGLVGLMIEGEEALDAEMAAGEGRTSGYVEGRLLPIIDSPNWETWFTEGSKIS